MAATIAWRRHIVIVRRLNVVAKQSSLSAIQLIQIRRN
jgi:hypothetical protein